MANFSFTDKVTPSESLTVTSLKQSKSASKRTNEAIESLVAEEEFFLTSSKTNSSKYMSIASRGDIEFGIPSTDDKLNNVPNESSFQDTIDSSETTAVIDSKDESESSNDNMIDSIYRNFTDASTSAVIIDKKDLQSPICTPRNSSVSLTVETIDCQNRSIFKSKDILNCLPINTNGGSKLSKNKPDRGSKLSKNKPTDTNVFSSTNSSYMKVFSSYSTLFKPDPLKAPSSLFYTCEETLFSIISRTEELLRKLIQEKRMMYKIVSRLENSLIDIIAKTKSRNFCKSKRNVCIQSIYKNKLEEIIECAQNILFQANDISKFIQGNYEIQLRKLAELLEKFCEGKLNYEISLFDKNWVILAIETFKKIGQWTFLGKNELTKNYHHWIILLKNSSL